MADIMSDFDWAGLTDDHINYQMEQIHEFNLMLIGLAGVGKSTLVKSLFSGMIEPEEPSGGPQLNEYSKLIDSPAVKLQLKCCETSNYIQHNVQDYVNYIENEYNLFFVDQVRHRLSAIRDGRIHACVYMMQATGKMTLSKFDIDCMLALHKKVNLIPVIAKADVLNKEDLAKFKENVKTSLEENGIDYFKFTFDEKYDENRAKVVKEHSRKFPFALVAAHAPEPDTGEWTRTIIRGKININDESVCDFYAFKKLLLKHCIFNLILTTHDIHYAKFRKEVLAKHNDYLYNIGLKEHEVELLRAATDPKYPKEKREALRAERWRRIKKVRELLKEELRHKMLIALQQQLKD